jgi:hypothetical protein
VQAEFKQGKVTAYLRILMSRGKQSRPSIFKRLLKSADTGHRYRGHSRHQPSLAAGVSRCLVRQAAEHCPQPLRRMLEMGCFFGGKGRISVLTNAGPTGILL